MKKDDDPVEEVDTDPETPAAKRKATPTQEARALRAEVKDLQAREKWTRIGKNAGFALLGLIATYGATKNDGETEARQAQTEVSASHKINARDIAALQKWAKAHAEELAALRRANDALEKSISKEFQNEIAKMQHFVDGYTAALARIPARGAVRKRTAEDIAALKSELEATERELAINEAQLKASKAARPVPQQRQLPKLRAPKLDVKALLPKKSGD